MATLYVTEYSQFNRQNGLQVAIEPGLVVQTLTPTASVQTSAAVTGTTRLVRMVTDTACIISFVTGQTGWLLPANVPEYFAVHGNVVFTYQLAS